jgi:hypothetical protein
LIEEGGVVCVFIAVVCVFTNDILAVLCEASNNSGRLSNNIFPRIVTSFAHKITLFNAQNNYFFALKAAEKMF